MSIRSVSLSPSRRSPALPDFTLEASFLLNKMEKLDLHFSGKSGSFFQCDNSWKIFVFSLIEIQAIIGTMIASKIIQNDKWSTFSDACTYSFL